MKRGVISWCVPGMYCWLVSSSIHASVGHCFFSFLSLPLRLFLPLHAHRLKLKSKRPPQVDNLNNNNNNNMINATRASVNAANKQVVNELTTQRPTSCPRSEPFISISIRSLFHSPHSFSPYPCFLTHTTP